MSYDPRHLDNALRARGGKVYSVQVKKGGLDAVIIGALNAGKDVIAITSSISGTNLIEQLGTNYSEEKVKIIDWNTYQTRSIVGVEELDGVLCCARDLINVNMAINKTLRTEEQKEVALITDILPAIVNNFSGEIAYTFLKKYLARMSTKSITGLLLVPDSFLKNPALEKVMGLLEPLPEEIDETVGPTPIDFEIAKDRFDGAVVEVLDKVELSKEERKLIDQNELGIRLCFECGGFLDKNAKACPTCKAPVDQATQTDIDMVAGIQVVSKCPNCGEPMQADRGMCSACGQMFSEDDKDEILGQGLIGIVEKVAEDKIGFIVCEGCGSFVNGAQIKCGLCGRKIDRQDAREPGSEDEVSDELADLLVTELELGDEERSPPSKDIIVCPKCHNTADSSNDVCTFCGADLREVKKQKRDEDLDGFWHKDRPELYLCPACGSFIPKNATNCEFCGITFDTSEDEAEEPVETVLCPECQTSVPLGTIYCPKCDFRIIEEKDADGHWYKRQNGLFMCPGCGAFIPENATNCSTCGIAFDASDEADEEPAETTLCPECQTPIPVGTIHCPKCDFRMVEEKDADGHWYKEQNGLFMCPGCGIFLATNAESCHNCGITFEPGEDEEIPESIATECPNCHKMLETGAVNCPDCGFDFTPKEDVDDFWYKGSDDLFMCPECGAFVSATSKNCQNCGSLFGSEDEPEYVKPAMDKEMDELTSMLVETDEELPILDKSVEEESVDQEIGELTDMLVETDEELPILEKSIEEVIVDSEIGELTDMLVETEEVTEAETDEELVDLELGQIEELAEPVPEDEELLHEVEELIPEDEEPLPEKTDLMLERDISPRKRHEGPIIQRAGRKDGMTNGVAFRMGMINGRGLVNGTGLVNGRGLVNGSGLVNGRGMVNGAGRVNGRGLVNGKGLVNGAGLVNGKWLVNGAGLVNGRGLVNGKGLVNGAGLVNGRGLVNGSGMINGNGLVNGLGLINGNGLVNGAGRINGNALLQHRTLNYKYRRVRRRSLWAVQFLVALLIASILLLPLFQYESVTNPPLKIDGKFSDWTEEYLYTDSDAVQYGSVDIEEFGATMKKSTGDLFFYLRTRDDTLLAPDNRSDMVEIFIDTDGSSSTGYSVRGIGADEVVEICGWDGRFIKNSYKIHNGTGNSYDFRALQSGGQISAAMVGSQLEVRARSMKSMGGHARMLFHVSSNDGQEDWGDFIISPEPGALLVNENFMAPDVLPLNTRSKIGEIELTTLKRGGNVTSIRTDCVKDGEVTINLERNGIVVGTLENGAYRLNRPLMLDRDKCVVLDVIATATNSSATGKVEKFAIGCPDSVESDLPVTICQNFLGRDDFYLGAVAENIVIDGMFSDWDDVLKSNDQRENITNKNIDITDYAGKMEQDSCNFYVKVSGNVMNGTILPRNWLARTRPAPVVPLLDSDADNIPDVNETGFEFDFDNDGIPDLDDLDKDNDGVIDFDNGGPDEILCNNITGATIGIGPQAVPVPVTPSVLPPIVGKDYLSIFIDTDENESTGNPINPEIGAEYMVFITGIENKILSNKLYEWTGQWVPVSNVSAALDRQELEAAIDLNLIAGNADQWTIYFEMTDWAREGDNTETYDVTMPAGTRAFALDAETKSIWLMIEEPRPETRGDLTLAEIRNSIDIPKGYSVDDFKIFNDGAVIYQGQWGNLGDLRSEHDKIPSLAPLDTIMFETELVQIEDVGADTFARFGLDPAVMNVKPRREVISNTNEIEYFLDEKLDDHWYRMSLPVPPGIPILGIERDDGHKITTWYQNDDELVFYDDPGAKYLIYSSGGYQEYFILGNETQMLAMYQDWGPPSGVTVSGPMRSNISFVAYGKVNIYLDEFENGYGFNKTTFTGADHVFTINAGETLTLSDNDDYVGGFGISGEDRFFTAGAPVFMVRGAWPETIRAGGTAYSGIMAAGIWEEYPLSAHQSSYTTPIGENLGIDGILTYMVVQAFRNNTHFVIEDPLTPASPDYSGTLQMGDVYTYYHANAGTQVSADQNIQAALMTSGTQYVDARFYTLTPESALGNEYFLPVYSQTTPRASVSRLYIHSFTGAPVYVEDKTGTTILNIPAGTTYTGYTVPEDSAAHVYTLNESDMIWVLGAFCSGGSADDWGFQAIDSTFLASDYYIANSPSPDPNGQPLWITPVDDGTTVYIDFDNDGFPDQINILNKLDVLLVEDPNDANNEGTHVYSDKQIAICYGISTQASTGSPAIDWGYTVLPFHERWLDLVLRLEKYADKTNIMPGEYVNFTIDISTDNYFLYHMNATDILPPGWNYIWGSTTIQTTELNQEIAADSENIVIGSIALNDYTETNDQDDTYEVLLEEGGGNIWSDLFTETFSGTADASWIGDDGGETTPSDEWWYVDENAGDTGDIRVGNYDGVPVPNALEFRDCDDDWGGQWAEARYNGGNNWFDLTGYNDGYINFSKYSDGMDNNNEGWRLEVTRNGGVVWTTVIQEVGTAANTGSWDPYSYQLTATDLASTQFSFRVNVAGSDNTDIAAFDNFILSVLTTGPSTSILEHYYAINNIPTSPIGIYTFNLDAWHDANAEGDDFTFEWSNTGQYGSYTNMLTVTKTADNDIYQTYSFPAGIVGTTMWVRVKDTDRTNGNNAINSLYIDEMFISVQITHSEVSGALADPVGTDQNLVWILDYDLGPPAHTWINFTARATEDAYLGYNLNFATAQAVDRAGNEFNPRGSCLVYIEPPPSVIKQLWLHDDSGVNIMNRTDYWDIGGYNQLGPFTAGRSVEFTLDPALASDLLVNGNVTGYIWLDNQTATIVMTLYDEDQLGTRQPFSTQTFVTGGGGGWSEHMIPAKADHYLSAGHRLIMNLTCTAGTFNTRYDSAAYDSRLFLDVNTYINVENVWFEDEAGNITTDFVLGETVYIFANVTDPFGSYDILGSDIKIQWPTGEWLPVSAMNIYEVGAGYIIFNSSFVIGDYLSQYFKYQTTYDDGATDPVNRIGWVNPITWAANRDAWDGSTYDVWEQSGVQGDIIDKDYTDSETSVLSTIDLNDHTETHDQDDAYEEISEISTGGTVWSNLFSETFSGTTDATWEGDDEGETGPSDEWWYVNDNGDTGDIRVGNYNGVPAPNCLDFIDCDADWGGQWAEARYNGGNNWFDLTGYTDGYINFTTYGVSNDANEGWRLEITRNGGSSWTNVYEEVTGGINPDHPWRSFSYQLTAADLASSQFSFRVNAASSGADDHVSFDNFMLDVLSAGVPTSIMEHYYSFVNIPASPYSTYGFNLDAWHDANAEGDDFTFEWSNTGQFGSYTAMLTVTKTADNDAYQTYNFPIDIAGDTIWIRVNDTDRTNGNTALQTLYIDEMFISLRINQDRVADSESTVTGSIALNDYTETNDQDDTNEVLLEEAGGNVWSNLFTETFSGTTDANWLGDDNGETAPSDEWWYVNEVGNDLSDIRVGNYDGVPAPNALEFRDCDADWGGQWAEARYNDGNNWFDLSGYADGYINFTKFSNGMDNNNEGWRLEVTRNAGGIWTTVIQEVGAAANTGTWGAYSYHLAAVDRASTQFSFRVNVAGSDDTDIAAFDNFGLDVLTAGPTTSTLEHYYQFNNIPASPIGMYTFNLDAWHDANTEGDDFTFAWSNTGQYGSYTNMLTVTKTADNDIYQTYNFPVDISGDTIWIRVLDADRTAGNNIAHALYIDHMFIECVPAIPNYKMNVTIEIDDISSGGTTYSLEFVYNTTAHEDFTFEIWNATLGNWEYLTDLDCSVGGLSPLQQYTLNPADHIAGPSNQVQLRILGKNETNDSLYNDKVEFDFIRVNVTNSTLFSMDGWYTVNVTGTEGNHVNDSMESRFYVSTYGVRLTPTNPTVNITSAGTSHGFNFTLTNIGGLNDTYNITISQPTLGWPSELWLDHDQDGIADSLFATDTDGDGVWDTVNASYNNGFNGPELFVAVNVTYNFTLVISVPVDADAGDINIVSITASSQNDGNVSDSLTFILQTPPPPSVVKELFLHPDLTPPDYLLNRIAPTNIVASTVALEEQNDADAILHSKKWNLQPVMAGTLAANGNHQVYLYIQGTAGVPVVRVALYDGLALVAETSQVIPITGGPLLYTFPLQFNHTFLAGDQIRLDVEMVDNGDATNSQATVSFDSVTYTSFIELRVDNYIDVQWVQFYNTTKFLTTNLAAGNPMEIRTYVLDPFGVYDITRVNATIRYPDGTPIPGLSNITMNVYQTDPTTPPAWNIYNITKLLPMGLPAGSNYTATITAVEGNGVTDTMVREFRVISAIDLAKIANVTWAAPGQQIQWTLFFNNSGTSLINKVWINETLPFDLTFDSDNSTQCSIKYSGTASNVVRSIDGWTENGFNISYEFTNVTPGSHWFVLNTTVNATVTASDLTNIATLGWYDSNETLTAEAVVIIIIPEYTIVISPVLFTLFIFLAVRRKKERGDFHG